MSIQNLKFHIISFLVQDGNIVKGQGLKAYYDFSLLLLKKVWSEQWSPNNHGSFQRPYRLAAKTVLLCAHRYGMASDVALSVISFLPRTWWPDERVQCWLYECEIENMSNLILGNKEQAPKTKELMPCKCLTVYACSQKHLNRINHEFHRRACKLPPFRVFNYEDAIFCREILAKDDDHGVLVETVVDDSTQNDEDSKDDKDDDDSCWESIGSNESNAETTKADLIHKYFETKSYRMQRMEEPAFAAFYQQQE